MKPIDYSSPLAFDHDRRRLVLVSLDSLGFCSDTASPLRQAILGNSRNSV